MSHQFRFFARPLDAGVWVIQDEERDHLAKTLRLTVGSIVEVFDGLGRQNFGPIVALNSSQATVLCSANPDMISQPPAAPIHILFGALRHRVFDDIWPSLVELGVDAIHVFRQQGTDKDRLNDKTIGRWDRIGLSAAKQSRRAWLPKIHVHQDLQAASAYVQALGGALLVGHPNHPSPGHLDNLWSAAGPVAILLGSEIGLREDELQIANSYDFKPISLGPHILRATTAMVCAVAVASIHRHKNSFPTEKKS